MPPDTTPLQHILDPHIGWAILCLVLALAAAVVALVIAGGERQ